MLFYYVRHGDPIYDPDSLTPLGERQAEAVAKRLAVHGIDEVYTSTSNRAKLTAKPTLEMLKLQATELDFCNESHAWQELTMVTPTGRRWLFGDNESLLLMTDPEFIRLGEKWYEHPKFAEYDFKKGLERITEGCDELFLSLGYRHVRGTGKYIAENHNTKRVALFAHQGFGLAFLSCVLDIPYPIIAKCVDMCHSGVTVINFNEMNGVSIPRMLMLSNDSHMYKEGLPTKYNNSIFI
ncbi:MAG: histidine phosphatase family protein [Clostridia bacterium]|nr:histidine phosphatase family protein [Clostridia bacterium]